MEILIVLAPVFLVIALGAALQRRNFFTPDFIRGLNKLTYWVGLPALLFESLATAGHSSADSAGLFSMLLGGTVIMVAIGYAAAAFLKVETDIRGTFVQACFRGNLAYMGLPIALALPAAFGERGVELRTSVLLAIGPMMVIYNTIAVVALLASRHAVDASMPLRVGKQALRNPLLIACAAGAFWSWAGLRLPVAIDRTLFLLGQIALPSALLGIGATLASTRMTGNRRLTVVASLLKTAACPLCGWAIAKMLGLAPAETQVGLILLATPCAAAGYTMVTQLGGDEALAASSLVLSTIISAASFAAIIWLG